MTTITYKCPNCDADLTFRPDTGDFGCAYCDSAFTGAELERIMGEQKIIDEQQAYDAGPGEAAIYSCPNCGAEVATDETTAATFCFFCHNPVIMKGRLTGEQAPDRVIPFAFSREEAKEKLIEWCRGRRYIDDGFFSDMQLEKLSGVYFPFYVVNSRVEASLSAQSQSLKVWVLGDIEYTETSVYAHSRAGEVTVSGLTLKAIDREDAELLNGVYPYDLSAQKEFSMGYLSGFLAEVRNQGREQLQPQATQTARTAAAELLEDTISGYGAVTGQNLLVDGMEEDWKYALLPAYMMTYRYKDELYYFAMNGQTGKVAGRVPVSRPKLNRLLITITAAAGVIGALLGGLL